MQHKLSFALQELRKDGFDLAEARYKELKPVLDEVILPPLYPRVYIGVCQKIYSSVHIYSLHDVFFFCVRSVGYIRGGAES